MRLEFEPNVSALPFVENEIISQNVTSEVERMLREGVKAAQDGDRSNARRLLLRVTEADENNENAWLWLASISEYPEELVAFLTNVLTINPANARAKKWLSETEALLGKAIVSRQPDVYEIEDNSEAAAVFGQTASPPATLTNGVACPFCAVENEASAFQCGSCHAALTLSDIEAILSNTNADRETIQLAVTNMEAEWNLRDFDATELTTLGIGHLNLRSYDEGLKYLNEALRLDSNNVILFAQINTLAIRLAETRRQNEAHDAMLKGKNILVVDDSARRLDHHRIPGRLPSGEFVAFVRTDGGWQAGGSVE